MTFNSSMYIVLYGKCKHNTNVDHSNAPGDLRMTLNPTRSKVHVANKGVTSALEFQISNFSHLCSTSIRLQVVGNFALLQYVSIAHEIGICPSSVRFAIIIISEPNARISFKFWLLHPLGHTLGRPLIFLTFFNV